MAEVMKLLYGIRYKVDSNIKDFTDKYTGIGYLIIFLVMPLLVLITVSFLTAVCVLPFAFILGLI